MMILRGAYFKVGSFFMRIKIIKRRLLKVLSEHCYISNNKETRFQIQYKNKTTREKGGLTFLEGPDS